MISSIDKNFKVIDAKPLKPFFQKILIKLITLFINKIIKLN